MSLADLSGTQDEWERRGGDAEREDRAMLGSSHLTFKIPWRGRDEGSLGG